MILVYVCMQNNYWNMENLVKGWMRIILLRANDPKSDGWHVVWIFDHHG